MSRFLSVLFQAFFVCGLAALGACWFFVGQINPIAFADAFMLLLIPTGLAMFIYGLADGSSPRAWKVGLLLLAVGCYYAYRVHF